MVRSRAHWDQGPFHTDRHPSTREWNLSCFASNTPKAPRTLNIAYHTFFSCRY